MMPLLEVIACSVADAVEAEKGGAKRLEIVRDLGRGGLTPPLELVAQIKHAVDLPLRSSSSSAVPSSNFFMIFLPRG